MIDRRAAVCALALVCACTAVPQAVAQPAPGPQVALSGRFGDRALLVVDGEPRTVAVGSTVDGVRLLGWRADAAEVSIGGRTVVLRMGGTAVDLTRAPPTPSDAEGRVVLQSDAQGHFTGAGSINGRSTRFMVDTGASTVTISQSEADRLGIAFRTAPRDIARTANGDVPVHRITLGSVRLGTIEVQQVPATVVPAALPEVLLGNSFLERVRMQREDRRMTLQARP